MNGNEIPIPNEGDEMVENSKTYVWTKTCSEATCATYEWVEKKTYTSSTYDFSNIYY